MNCSPFQGLQKLCATFLNLTMVTCAANRSKLGRFCVGIKMFFCSIVPRHDRYYKKLHRCLGMSDVFRIFLVEFWFEWMCLSTQAEGKCRHIHENGTSAKKNLNTSQILVLQVAVWFVSIW